jgi:hypothetical protein
MGSLAGVSMAARYTMNGLARKVANIIPAFEA